MAIDSIFNSASSAMTVISLVTFLGILWWTFGIKRSADFDAAASVPFDDDRVVTAAAPAQDGSTPPSESQHV